MVCKNIKTQPCYFFQEFNMSPWKLVQRHKEKRLNYITDLTLSKRKKMYQNSFILLLIQNTTCASLIS